MDTQKIKAKAGEICDLAKQIEDGDRLKWAVASGHALQIQRRADEILELMKNEPAEEVWVYDNGGKTVDRYIVIVDDDAFVMSHNPLSPQGVNQWAGKIEGLERTFFGAKLRPGQIPDDIRKAIDLRKEQKEQALQALAEEDGR